MLAKVLIIISILLFLTKENNGCVGLGGVCDVQQCCAKSHFKSKLQCCTFGLPCDLYTCCVSNGEKVEKKEQCCTHYLKNGKCFGNDKN
uniref:Uncharacterized protein n=1 Tax=Meloidogyne enterolobii TaxID=390850 RepID=A0A6V7X251_MELEN|nr:unnamed protein product [Meloidogyne enterolobii]